MEENDKLKLLYMQGKDSGVVIGSFYGVISGIIIGFMFWGFPWIT